MSIEILDDIIEELADSLGIYGAHTEEHPDGQCECRVCFSIGMSRRIRAAVQIERQLAAPPPDPELIDVIRIMGALKASAEATKPKRKRGKSKIYHVSLDIMSACEWPKSRLRKLFVNKANGRMLTSDEARRVLLQHLSEGRKFLPTGKCEGFDYQNGCPGHEELP